MDAVGEQAISGLKEESLDAEPAYKRISSNHWDDGLEAGFLKLGDVLSLTDRAHYAT